MQDSLLTSKIHTNLKIKPDIFISSGIKNSLIAKKKKEKRFLNGSLNQFDNEIEYVNRLLKYS